MNIAEYLADVQRVHATGVAQEHAYRPALERLFCSINDDVTAVNEPRGVKVGRPDFVFLRKVGKGAELTVGHCEAKDIGLDINPKGMKDFNKEQHERYVKGLPNLIYTNGLDFRFYKDGELAREISIADYLMGIQPKPDQFAVLANQLRDFATDRLQTITSAEMLARMMAGKAVLIKDILFNTLKEDTDLSSELAGQFKAFKDQLIHDLGLEEFSDIYAETIAYGMFAARLHDETLKTFSREEALQLLPKSNPFLRNLFTYVAGPNLDEGIRRTIDELAEIFQATDLQKLFQDFGKFTQRNDPFIHFYETFLAQYNPAKRKARGVWYTPEPVVNFIVRAVDDVLKSEFGLADGLADTSKITVDWETGQKDKKGNPEVIKKEMHRVQILDPAAGTGTFLAEVIKQIAPKIQGVAPGQWSSYVEKELIPRLHGFELLMASYAMCHMKLDMMLKDMGYKPTATPPRLGVYLTNSLEEGDKANQTLPFAQWLSNEAKQANTVKRDMPIMCVIGNPPYSGVSQNNGEWIKGLVEEYKYVDGKHFGERKHWLQDDYVKFIRFAEHLIEKNGEGVLAFISNHGYIDNPTFRGMRWHLLSTFDKVWIIDLHGSGKKAEQVPGILANENVFDIQQGVSLIIAAKKKNKNRKVQLAELTFGELWGSREEKYNQLWAGTIATSANTQLTPQSPQFFFVPKAFDGEEMYMNGISLGEFFNIKSSGIVTMGDDFAICDTPTMVKQNIQFLKQQTTDVAAINAKFNLGKNYAKWIITSRSGFEFRDEDVVRLAYRPFDFRFTYFDRNILWRWRHAGMSQFRNKNNLGLLVSKAFKDAKFGHAFVTSSMTEAIFLSGTTGSNAMNLPLYLYPDELDLDQTRRVNMDPKIRKAIEEAAMGSSVGGAPPSVGSADISPASGEIGARPDEVAIFDYIYGVLHCPHYRETYREFLKIDFPRVPYPPSPEIFWDVSKKGTALRRLHLMEDAAIGPAPFKFDGAGDSVVGKVEFKQGGETGSVFINETQYFEDVPLIAWNFYIGGYQPAQKWLKDRKGRALSFDDVRHYQKIIKILSETDRIMKTIEMPLG